MEFPCYYFDFREFREIKNSISDSLFDKNIPFGEENKVSDRLQIFPQIGK